MFAITQLKKKSIFPSSLLFKNANIQEYEIITNQLLSTGVTVSIPKHISWSHDTQPIRSVLKLLNTKQKSLTGERTWKQNILHEGLVQSSSTNRGLQTGGMLRRRTLDVESALEGGIVMFDTGERLRTPQRRYGPFNSSLGLRREQMGPVRYTRMSL